MTQRELDWGYCEEAQTYCSVAEKRYQQGKADATKELPTSLYCDGFNDGYEKGRADKYQEIVSEYMLLTEKQVAEIRADAIDEFVKAFKDNMLKYKTTTWTSYVEEIAEQMKEQNNA